MEVLAPDCGQGHGIEIWARAGGECPGGRPSSWIGLLGHGMEILTMDGGLAPNAGLDSGSEVRALGWTSGTW